MINISFAITACNETAELKRLIDQLTKCKVDGDEIIIQIDTPNAPQEMLDLISSFEGIDRVFSELNGDFSTFKNNLKKHCKKKYIFFIDADEEVNEDQIYMIREVLRLNPKIECFLVPRINTVAGLTQQHIAQWGWRVDQHNRVNWPDYQFRVCKNKPEIQWVNKVHERLVGYETVTRLPAEDVYALGHHKTIQKQEKQNNFYNKLQ
jgi:glycosyltransferase involved in cell wall biosynthesis